MVVKNRSISSISLSLTNKCSLKNSTFKVFPPLVKAVQEILLNVIRNKQPADKTIQSMVKEKRFGSRDRKFVNQFVYDLLRHYRLYKNVLANDSDRLVEEMILLNASHNHLTIINPEALSKDHAQITGQLHNQLKEIDDQGILESFPEWIWKLGKEEYGTQWLAIAKGLNSKAKIYLRVNTLRTKVAKLQEALQTENIETVLINETCLELPGRQNLQHHKLYKSGHFEIHDLASQAVCNMSQVEKGLTVVDGCAGAGGKTLHLSALMQNTGKIYASDIELYRMKQLKLRSQRARAHNIDQIKQSVLREKKEFADRVILDMPCSASGTIRRKPEIKWHLTANRLNKVIQIQRDILEKHANLLKIDGLLTYATCSVFKCEGEEQVQWFLQGHDNYSLVEEKRFFPHIDDADGFYIAVMKRK